MAQVLSLRAGASFKGAIASSRARTRRVVARVVSNDEGRTTNVGDFCSIDGKTAKAVEKSLGEKEADFIEALQNYYYDGEAKITDEEFENLKEELLWSGSKVAVLSSTEQRFLEAMMAYSKGKPIMSDAEFDELKGKLKAQNSVVTQAGPRCSIRSRKVYSDATPDYLKLTLLNLPGALLVLGFVFAIDDITGFEITKAIELPPPYSILFLWGLVLPTIYVLATSITNFILPDALILKAPCPNCNTVNQAYFGGIFSVPGNTQSAVVECTSCYADLEFNSIKREVVIVTPAEEKQKIKAEIAAKLAAMPKRKAKTAAKDD